MYMLDARIVLELITIVLFGVHARYVITYSFLHVQRANRPNYDGRLIVKVFARVDQKTRENFYR